MPRVSKKKKKKKRAALPVVEPAVDRFQFAYKTARGTDDVTIT